jgi:putative thioredoxin
MNAIVEAGDRDFVAEVLEYSLQMPVIVDFWAPWCGPCQSLGPLLERLATEFAGRVRLVKINVDENPEVARQYGIRSIPDVRAFAGGRQVDQFTGLLPESQIRAFIEGVIPRPADLARQEALRLRDAGDAAGAIAALRKSLALDDQHHLSRIDLAALLIDGKQYAEAATLLDAVRQNVDWDARVTALKQAIAFAAAGGSEAELSARVEAVPEDLEARLALASACAARGGWAAAMDQLLEIIRRDKQWRDGEARRQMLAIFNLAGDAGLVSEYRRRLASALN